MRDPCKKKKKRLRIKNFQSEEGKHDLKFVLFIYCVTTKIKI